RELFRAQGDCEDNFGLAEFLLYFVIAVPLHDLKFGELLAQALTKPGRQPPEIKTVVDHHHDFHRLSMHSTDAAHSFVDFLWFLPLAGASTTRETKVHQD
ncbi:MAG TPA: hypothetical protein VJQ54_08810, partial [Candidatus Sulfotelmatobacter sp.]|nr:hypothetical protein [Candidatus Sulfotelmatobacter sp.]